MPEEDLSAIRAAALDADPKAGWDDTIKPRKWTRNENGITDRTTPRYPQTGAHYAHPNRTSADPEEVRAGRARFALRTRLLNSAVMGEENDNGTA